MASPDVRARPRAALAPAPPTPGRRPRTLLRTATPYLYLLVPLAFLTVFTYVPVVNIVYYSLTSWDGLSPTKTFVGLNNYVEIATRPDLLAVFRTSLYYVGA